MPGKGASAMRFAVLEAKSLDRVRSRSAQDLTTSDSDLIPLRMAEGALNRAINQGDSHRVG